MKIEIRKMRTEDISSIQSTDECAALIAFYDGEVAGHVFIYYQCRWGAYGNQGLPSIVDLKVFSKYRNNGIAGKLMDEEERITSRHSTKIYLDVCLNSEYGAAQRLYIKRGYMPDGKGVYYEEKICPVNAKCANDDELTLCLIKELTKIKESN